MKVRAYFGDSLFAKRDMGIEDFKKSVLEYKGSIFIRDMETVLLIILPKKDHPKIISRAIGVEYHEKNLKAIKWVKRLKLPVWKY